jgi:hypothetical protein
MCPSVSRITPPRSSRSKRCHFDMSKVYLISSLCPPLGFKKEHEMDLSPGFSTYLAYTDLIALLIIGLLIHEVNVVLFLFLVSDVPESARFSMILVGQRTLQDLVSVEKLLSVHLILEIRCQTCKS